jgi:hypothetical protein
MMRAGLSDIAPEFSHSLGGKKTFFASPSRRFGPIDSVTFAPMYTPYHRSRCPIRVF